MKKKCHHTLFLKIATVGYETPQMLTHKRKESMLSLQFPLLISGMVTFKLIIALSERAGGMEGRVFVCG